MTTIILGLRHNILKACDPCTGSVIRVCHPLLMVPLLGVTVFNAILLLLTHKAGAQKIFCIWACFQTQVCMQCFIEHFLTLPPPTSSLPTEPPLLSQLGVPVGSVSSSFCCRSPLVLTELKPFPSLPHIQICVTSEEEQDGFIRVLSGKKRGLVPLDVLVNV